MYPNVERLMRERGVTIPDICEATGIPPTTIYDWRRRSKLENQPVYLSADNLLKVARFFGVTMESLMEEEGGQE